MSGLAPYNEAASGHHHTETTGGWLLGAYCSAGLLDGHDPADLDNACRLLDARDRGPGTRGATASSEPASTAPSIPDLLIAATAAMTGLTVLHLDKDFDLIAELTGQDCERLRTTNS